VIKVANNSGVEDYAIRLKDLITNSVTDTPESFRYQIGSPFEERRFPFEWSDMEDGFFFLSEDRTFVPGKGGQFRVRNPFYVILEGL
jgi:hypothetical protein